MWAHYACSHKGLVIIINNSPDTFIGAMPVRYKNKSEPQYDIDDIDFYSIYIKGEHWKYEQEWRIIESNGAGQYIDLPATIIHGIIFGANCLDDTKQVVTKLIEAREEIGNPTIKLYQAKCDFNLQQIEIHPYS